MSIAQNEYFQLWWRTVIDRLGVADQDGKISPEVKQCLHAAWESGYTTIAAGQYYLLERLRLRARF